MRDLDPFDAWMWLDGSDQRRHGEVERQANIEGELDASFVEMAIVLDLDDDGSEFGKGLHDVLDGGRRFLREDDGNSALGENVCLVLEVSKESKRHEPERRHRGAHDIHSRASAEADGRDQPEPRGRGEPLYREAAPEDRAASEEAYGRDDGRRDAGSVYVDAIAPREVLIVRELSRYDHERRRRQRHEQVRPKPDGAPVTASFETDDSSKSGARRDPKKEFRVAQHATCDESRDGTTQVSDGELVDVDKTLL